MSDFMEDFMDDDTFVDPTPPHARRVEANRLNAQRSTGPQSDGGKSRSSYNGLKHGLYAREVVLPGEDMEAFNALLASMMRELKPQGRAEEGIVRRAADIWWRLGRTAAIEAGLLNPAWSVDPRAERMYTGGGHIVDGFRVALDHTKTLDQLGRYEARLERALKRTFDLLFQMQAQRRRGMEPAGGEAPFSGETSKGENVGH